MDPGGMMSKNPEFWPIESYFLNSQSVPIDELAAEAYLRTCRTNFDAPGFCVINAGRDLTSVEFRQMLVDLKRAMSRVHQSVTQKSLVYLSAARFDQQVTTRPHLDGGPDECFLMLGYEPSEIQSEIELGDYSKCAFDLDLTPKEFMERHNPMFHAGYELIRPYSTRLSCFSNSAFQIVCVNNSSAPLEAGKSNWQGVLHTATIVTPDPSRSRVINSTMLASVPLGTPDSLTAAELNEFITTSVVRRRRYDERYDSPTAERIPQDHLVSTY